MSRKACSGERPARGESRIPVYRRLDSPAEEAVTSEPVSENSIPEAFWAVIGRFWHRKWHKIARLACGQRDRLTATKPLRR